MRILIATDAFPPVCGGSGWSTYELARGLRNRGHSVIVVQPASETASYDGFTVLTVPAPAPPVPFVRNYFRNERLYPALAAFLARVIRTERIDIVHAQHVLTGPAAIRAAKTARVPVVCTVRDYWPVCYWSDLLQAHTICPACSPSAMTDCVRLHGGTLWPIGLAAIPYMRANLTTKQADLARADAVIAVSHFVARELRRRSPALSDTRIDVIPNAVDVSRLDTLNRTPSPLDRPYAVFTGKLARNKGIDELLESVERAGLEMPLVAVGDGPERAAVERAGARSPGGIRVTGWVDRETVFQYVKHAEFLIFPSRWEEPLSRVLLESSALGVPIAAMNTGGTADIVTDGETGLLSRSTIELARDIRRLATDADLRARLGAAARERAAARFDVPVIVDRVEALYAELIERGQAVGA